MNKPNRREFFLTASIPLTASLPSTAQAVKPRPARKDCFLGTHFDLHPSPRDPALGRDVSEEMVERFLNEVRPDFVQYDCKGHVGYLGYVSRVGTSAPHIVQDSLEIWRRVTARHGVPLYIHFSGVYDGRAVAEHPEWALVNADGKPDDRLTSTFGPYVDRLMIPEIEEAARKYDLDGIWVDGECWAVKADYSPAAARVFREATGIETLPKGPKDPGWQAFLEVNRAQFRKYTRHYVEALHEFRPNFQITSAWLYSTCVPERPDVSIDYLSGDYGGSFTNPTARLEARYMSQQGKPWDLMDWGFRDGNQKPAVQVQQEASFVLAQGGAFQVYYNPTRAGKVADSIIDVMAKVSHFCRARQALSHQSESVPQVGVVYSTNSIYAAATKPFGGPGHTHEEQEQNIRRSGWGAAEYPVRGLMEVLLDNHYSVDVIPEWKLEEVVRSYPLIALPDWPDTGGKVKGVLAEYVRGGGKLLVAGAENIALFANELGVRLTAAPSQQPAYVTSDETVGDARGLWQNVEPAGAQVIEMRYPTVDTSRDGVCAATLSRYASGQIAAIYGSIGRIYAERHAAATRQFVRRVVERVFAPDVRLEGPPTIEMALRRKNGKLLVHLVNCTSLQTPPESFTGTSYKTVDFIPPIGPIRISLRLPRRPQTVTFEPEGRKLAGSYADGWWNGTFDKLEIHGIVSVVG
jgi:hypothetical protein